jgi:hypothetical protein
MPIYTPIPLKKRCARTHKTKIHKFSENPNQTLLELESFIDKWGCAKIAILLHESKRGICISVSKIVVL